MVTKILFVVLGMFIAFLYRLIRERGHAVFGVKDVLVQNVMREVISRYALLPLNMIHTGGTHQQVFRGGTVIAYFDDIPSLAGLPTNVRSYVVWGKKRRLKAAEELVEALLLLGYNASIHEPLSEFPSGTFLVVKSDAFLGSGHAFRPHWLKMVFLQIRAQMKK